MSCTLSNTLLSQLSELVAAHLGLHFPRERWLDLERAMRAASQKFGQHDVKGFVQRLLTSPLTREKIEILASHLTVGETYFFREKHSLEFIEQHVLPELVRARRTDTRQIRIWSAGCATGEEPYSIAISLSRMIPDLKDWNITILATDVNARSLRRASEGVYGEWSFRDAPPWVKPKYFTATADGRWCIAPSIKKLVTFAYLNLMEDAYPSLLNSTNAMDIILCRNVLMYFTPQAMKRIVHQFYRSLADRGWLIVSPTETSQPLFFEFTAVHFNGFTLYGKAAGSPETLRDFAPGEEEAMAKSAQPSLVFVEDREPAKGTSAREDGSNVSAVTGQRSGPPIPAPSLAKGLALCQRGWHEDAESAALALLSQKRENEQAMLRLARLHANQGRLREALEWCQKAIAAGKTNARAHYLRAVILQEQGHLDEATRSLRRALYADPAFVLGYFALGNLTWKKGRVKESQRHFSNTLALLAKYHQDDILPESGGLTAGRLSEIIALQKDHGRGAKRSLGPARDAVLFPAKVYAFSETALRKSGRWRSRGLAPRGPWSAAACRRLGCASLLAHGE